MGKIDIKLLGSFKPGASRGFSALRFGHAAAVAEAIEWLSSEVLPNAIKQDHELHERDEKPDKGFGKA